MTHVVIVQPYVPEYRVPLFDGLADRLERDGIRLTVAHGVPTRGEVGRGDAVHAAWSRSLPTRHVTLGSHRLRIRELGELARADLLVMEQAVGNLEAYRPLLRGSGRSSPTVALWGHGRTYTGRPGRAARLVKRWLTNRAGWFFAYTQSGADHVVADGFPADRVTVLNNTVDVEPVVEAVRSTTPQDLADFRLSLDLGDRPVLAFIGALDEPKRIPFLLDAFERMLAQRPDLVLVVAGDGTQRDLVTSTTLPVRYLGRVGPAEKALLAGTALALVSPGRVGLLAVDSFAMATPIVTTDWPCHAPEFDYLVADTNAVVTPDSVQAFTAGVLALVVDDERRQRLAAGCREALAGHAMPRMVEAFADGIHGALAAPAATGRSRRAQ